MSQVHKRDEEAMAVSDPRRRYHHGHLRRALLDSALHVLSKEGLAGLTLRSVARHAGVSEAAPYHHFSSKAGLVEALVAETFDQLAQALREAAQVTEGTPLEKLLAMGVAYVRFAVEHRASFQVLFRPELRQLLRPQSDADGIEHSPIDQAGRSAFQVLLGAIVACQQAGMVGAGDPLPLALTAWATVHGLAQLLLDGAVGAEMIPSGTSPSASHLASLVTAILARGLVARQTADVGGTS
jgi:AcrR family transcriptional regulator